MTNKIKLQKLQLMRSIEDTDFFVAYKKLVTNNHQDLTEHEKFLLLRFAVIFLNYGEKYLEKFGYKIILTYSNLFNDYLPLYDIAINKDYIPVAKFIEDNYLSSGDSGQSFRKLLMSAYKENFKHVRNGEKIYHSLGQKRQHVFSKNNENFIIVAPTSYGKSELIIHKVEDNLDKNVCIIVPTKSLLAQTRKNLIKNPTIRESQNKIITHPDMLNDITENFIAVLTQERLLRLLQKHTDLSFDIVLIDEAHNLIENDSREILTIQDLKILKKRNDSMEFYYFTPFLVEPQNLKVFPNEDLPVDKIQEFIKVEKYFVFDFTSNEKMLKIYDQFIDDFFDIQSNIAVNSLFEFIDTYATSKNIIYINRPKYIEEFSASIQNTIEVTEEIKKAQKALKDFLHQDYNLIKTIENGVVYHHGKMPENVRLYVEDAFSKIKEIKYIVTTSTLLQGVNIPAEKIFVIDTKKGPGNLNAAQFKNLSGRICRFSEVFDKESGSLTLLEPEVYVIKSEFSDRRSNIEKFVQERVKDNKVIIDNVDNPLIKQNLVQLNEEEKKIVREAEEYQENIEEGSSSLNDLRIVRLKIAKECFKNNIHDFDIFENEEILNKNLEENTLEKITTPKELISTISNVFINNIKFKYEECGKLKKKNGKPYKENGHWAEKTSGTYCERQKGHYADKNCEYCRTDKLEFIRLKEEKAQNFYEMFLNWRSRAASYSEMIAVITKYWNELPLYAKKLVYVGTTWGEIKKQWNGGSGGWKKLYVDLTNKTTKEIINLSIVKIKEEQDFVDYRIIPYVEILNNLGLIEQGFYEKIKYGTDDEEMIKMLKEGFSIELAKAITSGDYSKYINMSDNLKVESSIIQKMRENNENEILIFEIGYYTS